MSSINIYNNNTLNRPGIFNQKISLLRDIPMSIFSKAYKYKKELKENNEDYIKYNTGQIGYYIPYLLNNNYNYIEYLDINIIEMDNINNNNNYLFQLSYTLPEKICNIHYISVYRVILPLYPILLKEKLLNDSLTDINFFINNILIFKIGEEYYNDNIIYAIHNIIFISDLYIINYSNNNDYNIVYEIEIKKDIYDNYILLNYHKYYSLRKSIDSFYPFLILHIDDINNINSTSNYNIFNYLTPKKKINDNIYYTGNDCFKLFQISDLTNINKINLKILTNNNQKIFDNLFNPNNFDNNNVNNNCLCIIQNNKPGCCCTYIRNKNHTNYIIYIMLQIGIIKNDLLKKLIL